MRRWMFFPDTWKPQKTLGIALCLFLAACGSEAPMRHSAIRYNSLDSYTDTVMEEAAALLPVHTEVTPGHPWHLHVRYAEAWETFISGHAEVCSLSGGVTIAKEGEQDADIHLANVLVVAHELGHMLGARHDDTGVMRQGVNFAHTNFSEQSKQEIEECLG